MPKIEIFGPGPKPLLTLSPEAGQTLSTAIWLSGKVPPASLCAGLGRCGNCRCRFLADAPPPTDAEKKYFTKEDLQSGWRLACRHALSEADNFQIELPSRSLPSSKKTTGRNITGPILKSGYLGIDLGTTSIQWQIVDAASKKLDAGSCANPQCPAGADVVARIEFAENASGMKTLAGMALNSIGEIILKSREKCLGIEKMCVAGNTAMTEILLQKDISGLAAAPYAASFPGNVWLDMGYPHAQDRIPTYFPPLPGPFIGGDITAGLAWLKDVEKPFILADLGTNAEMALVDGNGNLFFTSAPLGPALEGIGPAWGQPAGPGVITEFLFTPQGLHFRTFENSPAPPYGISATGYLSLLAILLKSGLMREDGHFNISSDMPLTRKLSQAFVGNALKLPHGMFLYPDDIEMLLKVKAVFNLALQKLLNMAQTPIKVIKAVYLAGALGQFISADILITLGFFPLAAKDKIIFAGNTSLYGACLLAREGGLDEPLQESCSKAKILQLAEDPDFLEDYIAAMRWGFHAI